MHSQNIFDIHINGGIDETTDTLYGQWLRVLLEKTKFLIHMLLNKEKAQLKFYLVDIFCKIFDFVCRFAAHNSLCLYSVWSFTIPFHRMIPLLFLLFA